MAKFLRMSEHSVYQVLSDCVTTLISGIDSESTLVKNVSRTCLVVKSLHFQCRGHGFDPWSGKLPPATRVQLEAGKLCVCVCVCVCLAGVIDSLPSTG